MSTGIIIILLAIAVIVFLFFKNKSSEQNATNTSTMTYTVEQTIPDSAVSFGYKCIWFAVKTSNQEKLIELLKIKNVEKCNWKMGIDKAYKGSIFITPAIDGWTLACGLGLPTGDSKESIKEVKKTLQTLSKEFGEAQFFCTHRVVEYHCWMKAINGQVTRVYSYLGEAGENIAIEGIPTDFEKKYKLINTFSEEAKGEKYFEDTNLVLPNEELLMQVAGHWSINPTELENRKDLTPSIGLIGER